MTTQNLDLSKMGLASMTDVETQSVDGGINLVQAAGKAVTSVGSAFTGSTNTTENGIVGGLIIGIVGALLFLG